MVAVKNLFIAVAGLAVANAQLGGLSRYVPPRPIPKGCYLTILVVQRLSWNVVALYPPWKRLEHLPESIIPHQRLHRTSPLLPSPSPR